MDLALIVLLFFLFVALSGKKNWRHLWCMYIEHLHMMLRFCSIKSSGEVPSLSVSGFQ